MPSSVVYKHIEPLSYITLNHIGCDDTPALATNSRVSAEFFKQDTFGAGAYLPTSRRGMSMVLENVADISVKVYAVVFGTECVT